MELRCQLGTWPLNGPVRQPFFVVPSLAFVNTKAVGPGFGLLV